MVSRLNTQSEVLFDLLENVGLHGQPRVPPLIDLDQVLTELDALFLVLVFLWSFALFFLWLLLLEVGAWVRLADALFPVVFVVSRYEFGRAVKERGLKFEDVGVVDGATCENAPAGTRKGKVLVDTQRREEVA